MLDYITWAANPDIISSPITIRWYGLMFAIGFIIGYEIVARMFRHEGAPERWLGILLIYVVVATIIGARLGHVFFYEWDVYSQDPIRILYIWEGGLASHGGTIAIILAVILYSIFVTKRSPLWTFDRLVIAIALVGGLIRLGNLFNSEIFGTATTLPWGFMFVRSREWHMLYEGQAVHPTQIYEALCYFALFGLLMWMYWKKNAEERPGLILGVFFIGIFLPRFLIEFIKNDQVAREATMTLNLGQQLSIPFILLGIGLVMYAMMRPRVHLTFPNRFADEKEPTKAKKRR
ncbi:prolipoprotein diacylglyceryl transferase [uncultured Muribaculum sp.]|uniref:prolipoprotein diacylglyceryl transferase n=1 Tax=uncultured Muribaculum sp. TaxID=1918613 RepID=UPI0025E00705|nr:prolipoprotein diacylglyceryl transferase [uncultured Muribaculum sp.]